MTSGRQTLRELDAAIAGARRDLNTAATAAGGDTASTARLEARELSTFANLARIRLDLLQNGAASEQSLRETEKKAVQLLQSHTEYLSNRKDAVRTAEEAIERLEREREEKDTDLDAAIDAHEAAAAKTRARLDSDAAYQAQADAVDEANETAARALQKLETARADRAEKGAAYESDVLFKYLHDRQYATSSYKAFPLFALLDDWVAGLIKYRRHKLNYDRLLEIPERLAEHAERLDDAADITERALEAAERAALKSDGVDALRDAAAAIRAAIEAIDRDIADAEQTHADAAEALQRAANGADGPLKEAEEMMARALKALSIPDLKRMAAETATLEDDALVDDLIDVKRECMELEDAQDAARRTLKRRSEALADLEDIRQRFKKARFDSRYSAFRGDGLITSLLAEFAAAAITRKDFWRRLKKSHYTSRRDWENDFGGDEWRDVFGLPQDWGGRDWRGGDWPNDDRFGRNQRRTHRKRRRIPRAPRRSRGPRVKFPRGGGGFGTGGGF